MTLLDFVLSIGVSLATAVIYTVILGLAAYGIGRHFRRGIFELLGISSAQPALRIFMSRLKVEAGSSTGAEGKLALGYSGLALGAGELSGAHAIERLAATGLPPFLRSVFQGWTYFGDVDTQIDVSPENSEFLDAAGTEAIVFLGSDVYSAPVRDIYWNKRDNRSFIRFVSEATDERFHSKEEKDPTFAVWTENGWGNGIPARKVGQEIGTVQRITLKGGRRVVMCAGISSSSTSGSATYLCEQWKTLHKRFGSDDFLVVLVFPGQVADGPPVKPREESKYERRRKTSAVD